jgi:hypothetical protein
MYMKAVRTVILLITLAAGLNTYAQPPGSNPMGGPPEDDKGPVRDWIRTKRIGFFTDKLNLTPDEATKFWPVYNIYTKEIDDLRAERRKDQKTALRNIDDMDDAAIGKALDAEFVFRQKELDIEHKYLAEWKKVLPLKKVALLLKAEQEFKIWILKEWKNHGLGPGRAGDGPPGPPGGPPNGSYDR